MRPLWIKGIGAVTPLGSDWPTTWHNLLCGTTGFTDTARAGVAITPDIIVAAVPELERSFNADGIGPAARLIGRALSALEPIDWARVRTVWASTNHGETGALDVGSDKQIITVPKNLTPKLSLPKGAHSAWVSSACTSGLHAVAFAWLEAQEADSDWIVLGGDSLAAVGIAGFYAAGATGNGPPAPLRSDSGGMVVGEGAVALYLTSNETPGTPAILAVAMSCDAGHSTHPDPSGRYLEQAIRQALETSKLHPHEIAAVIAHGTGTHANDTVEAEVIRRVWEDFPVAVTSVKGNVGHIMGAAGLLNIAVADAVWKTGHVPPSAGLGLPRSGINLAGRIVEGNLGKPVLALASGFGGNNAVAVIG